MLPLSGRVLSAAVPLLPERVARRVLRRTHPFDLRHCVDTGGLLYAPDLVSGHPHDQFNEGYYATAPSVFCGLAAKWKDTLDLAGLRVSDYSFVDLGCGKGRVVLLASELPFRRVTGVELHPDLCAIARRNVERWLRRRRACPRIEVACGDVLDMPIPDGPVVLFLFNSFEAEVVRLLMQRLAEAALTRAGSAAGPIDLLYVHPDHAAIVESTPGTQTLFDGDIALSKEDALADAFEVTVDRCGIYRLRGAASAKS